jgi:hemoglobin
VDVVVASAKEGVMSHHTLYERLGGGSAITAVVDDFVGRCAGDSRINAKFGRTDVPRLKSKLVEQISAATGGKVQYTGRTMSETHRGMQVTAGEFDALVEDLVATLNKFAVGEKSQAQLLDILGPLRGDIVEVESPATGTPLPEAYETAPPLAAV